jgi:hypothetical protein
MHQDAMKSFVKLRELGGLCGENLLDTEFAEKRKITRQDQYFQSPLRAFPPALLILQGQFLRLCRIAKSGKFKQVLPWIWQSRAAIKRKGNSFVENEFFFSPRTPRLGGKWFWQSNLSFNSQNSMPPRRIKSPSTKVEGLDGCFVYFLLAWAATAAAAAATASASPR